MVDPLNRRRCATIDEHVRLLFENPGYGQARIAVEANAFNFKMGAAVQERALPIRIPVVVHVVANTAAQNVSDAQIASQIDRLNLDFRAANTDFGNVPPVWQPVAADAQVEFFLADTDPDGSPTGGITRTQTATSAFSVAGNDIKFAASGGADAWPADRYLNMWVAPDILDQQERTILGYAEFPGAPAEIDGVVILNTAFGVGGTAVGPYDQGRTATHEVGHWLNLFHIWGDDFAQCSGDDFVDDTPNCAGPNFECPTFPNITCGNEPDGDMFMNYMDYVPDACMVMFTAGQVTRMMATFNGPRSSIGS